MNKEQEINSLLRDTLEAFTEHHNQIEIHSEMLGRVQAIRVKLHTSDTGRIIGEHGIMIKAIQEIWARVGYAGNGGPAKIKVLEPEPGEKTHYPPYQDNPHWPKEPTRELFQRIADAMTTREIDVEIHTGKDFSLVEIIAQAEDQMDTHQEALGVLANAIGKANGQILHLEIGQGEPSGNH